MKLNAYFLVATLGSMMSQGASASCCLEQSGVCPTGYVKNTALSALPTLNLGSAVICNEGPNCSIGAVSTDANGVTTIEGVPACPIDDGSSGMDGESGTTDGDDGVTNTASPSDESCPSLVAKATVLAFQPKCALVRALFLGANVLAGTPEEVSAVCDASPSCVEELEALVNQGVEKGCNFSASLGVDLDQIQSYGEDVKAITNFFCTDDCYAVTKAVAESGGGPEEATCPCLLALQETTPKLSQDAKEFLAIDDEFLAEVSAATEAKGCEGGTTDGDGAMTSAAGRSSIAGIATILTSLLASKMMKM